MKKAGIISLYANSNYGNKLQNYALQEILKKENLDVETLNTKKELIHRTNEDAYVRLGFKLVMINIFRNILKFFNPKYVIYKEPNYSAIQRERNKNISEFDKLIKKSPIIPIKKNYKKIDKEYDYLIFGSDQVWNPFFIKSYNLNLGIFAKEAKKISYAASFGVSDIFTRAHNIYKKGLNKFDEGNLSVREFQGEEIIKDLTGKKSRTVLDPTMLILKEKWTKLAKEPKNKPKGKYLLTYILGDNKPERREFIKNIAKEKDLEVINLHDDTDSERAIIGVEEFLWFFNNSEIIFADSFHAGVFSILFEKPFYILERNVTTGDMSSRFDTLLKTFELEDRRIKEYNIDKINYNIDYKKVNKILEKRKKESLEFLKEALSGK